ncbi:MAG: PHP domain-containing protein [Clostridia bacterium]|nr:PHP domain-containing protein [Clostridia bacterium]
MSADLHCHSVYSDGTLTVKEIILLAKAQGLHAVAITDHDTFSGCNEAVDLGSKIGITVIPGAEISSYDYKRNRKVHLLCYMPQDESIIKPMTDLTTKLRTRSVLSAVPIVLKHYPIPQEMIFSSVTPGSGLFKQHIMTALINAGYTNDIYGELFRSLFGKNGIAKIPYRLPDVFDALKLIRESGAVCVLAHPNVYNSYEIIPELISNGLDGIEVNYPRAKDSDHEVLGELCRKNDLIITGGTDFHGRNTSSPLKIGTGFATDEQLDKLIALAEKRGHTFTSKNINKKNFNKTVDKQPVLIYNK